MISLKFKLKFKIGNNKKNEVINLFKAKICKIRFL